MADDSRSVPSQAETEVAAMLEAMTGVGLNVDFDDYLAGHLNSQHTMLQEAEISTAREEHGLTGIETKVFPHLFQVADMQDEDWDVIRESPMPIVALYAASEFRRRPMLNDRFFPPLSVQEEALLKSLPLVHSTSVDGFLAAVAHGAILSDRELLALGERDPLTNLTNLAGGTNGVDREMGLDAYVFSDFGRPSVLRAGPRQSEVVLVIEPEAMLRPGSFMTEKDAQDCIDLDPESDMMVDLQAYLRGVSVPEYFYLQAKKTIQSTTIEEREVKIGHGSYGLQVTRNTIDSFANGRDSQRVTMLGVPQFSTYEVKTPSIPIDSVKRVVVKTAETLLKLQTALGDRFDIVLEPNLAPGNYQPLHIPGKYEALKAQLEQVAKDTKGQLSDENPWQDILEQPWH